MADRTVSELVAASQVLPGDLFVLEQGGTAKKLTGQVLENWLLSFADGHGGIQKIEKRSTAGRVDTYRITFSDTTFTDFTVTNGEKGDKGDNTYTWIKYASKNPADPPHSFGDIPDKWIGIYAGDQSSAPKLWNSYKWYEIKGEKGDTGAAASLVSQSIEYQSSSDGNAPPEGNWLSYIPAVSQGKYLWVRVSLRFNIGDPIVFYSASRMGIDGRGTVKTVNNIAADSKGNIDLNASSVKAIPNSANAVKEGNIAPQSVSFDKLTLELQQIINESGLKLIKLWENASPTSSFPAQTINIQVPAKENDLFIVTSDGEPVVASLKASGFNTGMFFTAFANLQFRAISAYPDKIVFGNCEVNEYNTAGSEAQIHNTSCIPRIIYLLEVQ